jgi:uncharacterized RDD family membrane protein YckC
VSTPENPARWAPDPLGRHQYRYWDGAQWTDHVADDGVVATDPVAAPAPPTTPTDAAPAAATPTDALPTDALPTDALPTDDAPGWAAPTAATRATAPVGPYQPIAPAPAPAAAAPRPGTGAGAWSAPVRTTYDPTKVLGRRYGAFVIDAIVCMIAFGIFFFATADTHTRAEMLRDPECHVSRDDSNQIECDNRLVVTLDDTVYEAELLPFAALSVAFTFLYFAVVEGLAGGSLGKQMTGIRVVTPEGARIGVGRSTVRWLVFAVDGPLSIYLCGIITSSVSSGHRRLGDMAASTYVVGRNDAGRPVTV